jgi:two-component system chemotaxis sensor kinase CheA
VTITDDGRGLNRKRILARAVERGLVSADEASNLTADAVHRLILAPGFSTAAALTETSGRGVGMDVALTEVQRLGGELDIATTPGLGTWFTMRLPLTAAIQTAVLVQAADQILAVPERAIEAVAELARAELADMDGRPAYLLHGQPVPVLSLASLLWPDDPVAPASVRAQLVIINHEGELVALEVDQVLRRQELLLLRLHPVLAACAYVGGALVLSDGKVALLLDAEGLVAAGREISWQVPAQ